MPFLLQRGGRNIPLEVQRWQYFLLKNSITQTGDIDAQFGAKTEQSTKIFQVQHSLKVTGQLDAATLDAIQNKAFELAISSATKPSDMKSLFMLILKSKDQELKNRQIDISMRRLALLEKQSAQASKIVTDQKLTPDQLKSKLGEIYGVKIK